ncbi:MAG: polysaccharide biosynthesis C-terminal domain-containing protein [Lachnospiraceae bacterium]|nr:polysaccharide biosynthesis C-terminal domain-containing protein [Lachnospiraceae bacterium]
MDVQERRTKEKRNIRRDYYIVVGILTYAGSLIFRIPLFHLIGEKGVGYFGIVYELYLVIGFVFAYGLSEATAALIRFRMKREQFKNAQKVLNGALLLSGILGVMLCVILFVSGNFLAEKLMGMSLCGLAVSVMAPAVVFCLLTGVLKGYFQGNGSKVPATHSKIIELVFLFAGGLTGAYIAYGYGQKVSALLLNQSYAPAYGAMGACVGILISSVFCFLHAFLLYLLYRRRAKKQESRDLQKYTEKSMYITRMLSVGAMPYAGIGLIFHGLPFFSGCIYMHLASAETDGVLQWGNYYGKLLVVIGLISALLSLPGIEPVRKIVYWTEREEYRIVKEKIALMIHQCVIWTVPATIFTAVLAENILNLFFKGNNMTVATWMTWGSINIIFYVFAVIFSHILIRLRKSQYVLIYGGIAFAAAIILIYILLTSTGLGILSLVIGSIVFYGILTIAGFVIIRKEYQYIQEWVRSFAFPVVAAGISGLIVMLLNKAFISLTGSTISFFICLPVGIAAYVVLLLAIRCVNEKELENMLLGRLLIRIGRTLHLL